MLLAASISWPVTIRWPPIYLSDYALAITIDHALSHASPIEPKTLNLQDSQWVAAMEEELQALHVNQTWELIPWPSPFILSFQNGCIV